MRTATRHAGFLVALALGTVAGAATLTLPLSDATRALIGLDVFFASYLVAMIRRARRATPQDLRRHAADRDEGLPLILLLALTAIVASLTAILMVLRAPSGLMEAALALTAAPLGWAVVHTLLAMHYAHAHYATDTAALAFPGTAEPDFWDFLYFSFGIGMTAQVSDVTVQTSALRRWVLAHAAGSFFYNTIILALAVNAGLALAG
jgi:uncharacterized membrane protein